MSTNENTPPFPCHNKLMITLHTYTNNKRYAPRLHLPCQRFPFPALSTSQSHPWSIQIIIIPITPWSSLITYYLDALLGHGSSLHLRSWLEVGRFHICLLQFLGYPANMVNPFCPRGAHTHTQVYLNNWCWWRYFTTDLSASVSVQNVLSMKVDHWRTLTTCMITSGTYSNFHYQHNDYPTHQSAPIV